MHHDKRNNRCNPIARCCDQPTRDNAANAFQNQCAYGIQQSPPNVAKPFSSLSNSRDTEDGDTPSTAPAFEKLPHSAAFIKTRMASNTVNRPVRYAKGAR